MTKLLFTITLIASLAGCAQKEFPLGEIVAESQSPAIGKDFTVSEPIGIETLGGVFTELIQVGVAVPCEKSEVFSTAADNQDQIEITLYRGNAKMVKDNKKIGQFLVRGIPAASRGIPNIQVSFIVTTTDIMLKAKDMSSGRIMDIVKIEEGSAAKDSQISD